MYHKRKVFALNTVDYKPIMVFYLSSQTVFFYMSVSEESGCVNYEKQPERKFRKKVISDKNNSWQPAGWLEEV